MMTCGSGMQVYKWTFLNTMFYTFDLSIPANTSKSNPTTLTCQLTHGVIRQVSIAFPPGPKGLAHLVIYRWEAQAWPTNPDESFAWDNYTIKFNEEFDLIEQPYTLKLVGWNDDDTHEHTITVRFELGGQKWGFSELLTLQTPVSELEE